MQSQIASLKCNVAMKLVVILACALSCAFGMGAIAANGEFPYLVSVRYDDKHICAGSILNEKHILTAARCLKEFAKMSLSSSRMKIVTGTNSLKESGDVYEVMSYETHKDYHSMNLYHDIAIIKLKKSINFYEFVEPVHLRKNDIGVDRRCKLIGWGQPSYKGATQDKVQYIDLKTIDLNQCKSIPKKIDSQICTFTENKEGSCEGDFGSPLIDQSGDLIGIYSSGKPHGKGEPDVFTKVYKYLEWIEKTAKV